MYSFFRDKCKQRCHKLWTVALKLPNSSLKKKLLTLKLWIFSYEHCFSGVSFKALRRTRGEEICGQEANSLIGFHKSVPLLPSLTPRAKASSSCRFLSCLLALWVIRSPPKPPRFSSASMLDCSGSHRLSISSAERCGGETGVLCSRRCRQQPRAEAAATPHSPLTQEGD